MVDNDLPQKTLLTKEIENLKQFLTKKVIKCIAYVKYHRPLSIKRSLKESILCHKRPLGLFFQLLYVYKELKHVKVCIPYIEHTVPYNTKYQLSEILCVLSSLSVHIDFYEKLFFS